MVGKTKKYKYLLWAHVCDPVTKAWLFAQLSKVSQKNICHYCMYQEIALRISA